MILFIFITFCTSLTNASPQYYYIGQPPVYHIPATYNAFPHQYSTFHGNPHYQHFRTIPAHIPQVVTTPAPTLQRTQFTQNNDPEYRGFAYQTRTDNGATSHVVFVTGPQAQQVNSRVFNNFNSQVFGQNVNQARTIASEMIDPVQKTEEKQNDLPKSIQDIYSPPALQRVENNDPFQFFQTVFQNNQNPSTRLINFYSRNTNLFASQVPGYPANVAPLPQNTINPRILHIDNSNNTESVTEKQTNEQKKTDGEVAAESIITNTRFKLNDVENQLSSIKDSSSEESTPTSINLGRSTSSDTLVGLLDALPSTQRALGTLPQLAEVLDPELSTSISSSSSELDSAIIMSRTNNIKSLSVTANLLNSSTVNGIPSSRKNVSNSASVTEFPTLRGLLIQRFGSQPEVLAEESDIIKESPSSEFSDESTSESTLMLKSEAPGSSFITTSTSTTGLNTQALTTGKYDHVLQDLISGTISARRLSADKVIENVSKSGFLTYMMRGTVPSTDPITTSSREDDDVSDSSTTFIILEQTTNSVTAVGNVSTVDQTTEQLQLTTNNDNVIVLSPMDTTMKTFENLALSAESSLAETTQTEEDPVTSRAGDSNEDNTTEHVSITTDALMTTTSQ